MLSAQTKTPYMGQEQRTRGRGRPPAMPESPLELWFAETGTSWDDIAHQLNITTELLRAIARGTKKTNANAARSLCLITGRKVSTDQILDQYDLKQESE